MWRQCLRDGTLLNKNCKPLVREQNNPFQQKLHRVHRYKHSLDKNRCFRGGNLNYNPNNVLRCGQRTSSQSIFHHLHKYIHSVGIDLKFGPQQCRLLRENLFRSLYIFRRYGLDTSYRMLGYHSDKHTVFSSTPWLPLNSSNRRCKQHHSLELRDHRKPLRWTLFHEHKRKHYQRMIDHLGGNHG